MSKTKVETPISILNTGFQKCLPGYPFGPSIRGHYIIHYILSGKGTYTVGNHTYSLRAGNGFIIHPSDLVYYRADMDDPWHYTWVDFYGDDAEKLMKRCGYNHDDKSAYIFYSDKFEKIENVMHELDDVFYSNQENRQLFLVGSLYRLLSYISDNSDRAKTSYVDSIKEYIHYNFPYDISVKEIAQHVGLNRSYMCKIFTNETGISPQEYLLRHRISKAAFYLRETTFSISEVAYSCGFNNITHFSYTFKKRNGRTPSEYRK